jgi:hypothetical protein
VVDLTTDLQHAYWDFAAFRFWSIVAVCMGVLCTVESSIRCWEEFSKRNAGMEAMRMVVEKGRVFV